MEFITSLIIKYLNLIERTYLLAFNINHFYFITSISFLAIIIDLIYSGWGKSSLKRLLKFEKSTQVDLISWIIENLNIYNTFSLIFSFGMCYYLVGLVQNYFNFNLEIKNAELQFIVIFIISDFKGWISHYCFHISKNLWQLHSFHHSATNFNILTRQRGHFLESEIKRFFDVIPFIIFGAPISTYLFIKIFTELHQMLVHSSSNSNWGLIGKYILVSPAAHRVHHSIDPKHFNKNFGVTFIFWDRLFKTYHKKEKNIILGIPENPFNKGYVKDVLHCQWLFIRSIFNSLKNIYKFNNTNKT
jgi:sterol desaturase/sphingolipid hydroxylase (fatty acid hydroxylase superfamily)